MREALAQLPGLGMAHQHRVAECQALWPAIVNRRLHLARALQRIEPRACGQIDRRQTVFACTTRRTIAAAEAGVDARRGDAHDLDGVARRWPVAEVAVVVEERGAVESRPNRDLG